MDEDGPGIPEIEIDPIKQRLDVQRLISKLFGIHGTTELGRYEILRELGRGGMGVVYLARDHKMNRNVAIKTLRARGGSGLLEEARVTAQLVHPNIVTVHDCDEDDGMAFIVMEYVDGVTLKDWLAAQRRSRAEILAVFMAAGEGLAAAHREGIIHRDFKPTNVMIDRDGRARVMDFGLARPDPGRDETLHDAGRGELPGEISGTPAYMSPEQFRGGWTDASSDQFSFCVALHEALYGEHPFGHGPIARMWEAAERGEIRTSNSGRDVPEWLREIVVRGLAPRAADRFPSMGALLGALAAGERAATAGDRVTLRIRLSRSFDDFDEAEQTRIQEILRLVARDPYLLIERVYSGSVVVEFNVSRDGAERLMGLGKDVLSEKLDVRLRSIELRPVTDFSDETLVLAWGKGDSKAGHTLILRYYASINRFFRNKVEDQEVADLTQATFLAIQDGLGRVRGDASVRTWLFSIARNILVAHLRRRQDQQRLDPEMSLLADLKPSPPSMLDAERRQRLLLAALRRLPVNQQVMFELYYWEKMPLAEIAEVVGMAVGTLKSHMRSGRRRLEAWMEELPESGDQLETTRSGFEGWVAQIRRELGDEGNED